MNNRDIFLAVLLNIIWGSAFAFSGYALTFYAPIFAYALRFFSTGAATVPFHKFPKKYAPNIIFLSLLQTITFCGVAYGIKHLDSSTTAILTRLDIVFTIVLGAIIFGEKISLKVIVGILICFLAIYIISGGTQMGGIKYVALVIFASFVSGCANIVVKTIKGIDSMTIVSWTSLLTGIELFAISFFMEKHFILKPLTLNSVLVMVYLGAVCSYLAYFILYYLLRKYDTAKVMPYNFLRLPVSIMAGYLLMGEQITTSKVLGMILILLGIYVSQSRRFGGQKN